MCGGGGGGCGDDGGVYMLVWGGEVVDVYCSPSQCCPNVMCWDDIDKEERCA
jgi:hypothetical protein